MINVHESKNKIGTTVGAWVFDENDSGVFLPNQDIIKIIAFIAKLSTTSPGYDETYDCVNCALTFTNQVMISDCTEDLILELDELTKFVTDLQAVL